MRVAVVSPFLDRRHGTELCIVEQIERLAFQHGWEIHIYSQRVEDIVGLAEQSSSNSSGHISWHKVSGISGPHLFNYLWWFLANYFRRWRDSSSGRCRPDLTYSPGINCFDADAIVVHIVFREFYTRVRSELLLPHLSVRRWPRAIHRYLYYHLLMFLEQRIYSNRRIHLAAVSQLVAAQLKTYFQRDDVFLIPNAVDTVRFSSRSRLARRPASRACFDLSDDEFILLLIGNDWKKKGLDQLLRAIALERDLPLRLLVVGRDDQALYTPLLRECHLLGLVRFLPPSPDVLQFYAAADAYVGPSLEDAFGLPVLEAMACGLPVISTVRSGVSAVIEDGINGLLLRHPEKAEDLAALIRLLVQDKPLREKLGQAAAETAARHTWDHNTALTRDFLLAAASNHSP